MIKLLKKYLREFIVQTRVGQLSKVFEAVFELLIPLIVADIVDACENGAELGYILGRGGVMLALCVVGLGSTLLCQYNASRVSQGVGTALRRDLFSHIHALDLTEQYRFGESALLTRLTSDIDNLQLGVAMYIRLLIRAPFLVIGATIMSFVVDYKSAFVFLACTPLLALVFYVVTKKSVPQYRKVQHGIDELTTTTEDSLRGVMTVKGYALEDECEGKFARQSHSIRSAAVAVGNISALLNPLSFLIINSAVALLLSLGAKRVDGGNLTTGEIVALISYMTQISISITAVAHLVLYFTRAQTSAVRVSEVLNTPATRRSDGEDEIDTSSPNAIETRALTFGYGGEKNAISEVSISVRNNGLFCILGGTGSGKSTLAELIDGHYDNYSGEIILFGKELRTYSRKAVARAVSIVPQSPSIVSGTIASNLQMRKVDATDEEMDKALTTACLEDYTSRGEGLDYALIAGGGNLSGGQRARLAIARALIDKPSVLILDNSFAALDNRTAAKLLSNLRRDLPDTTLILITERTDLVASGDGGVVLKDGRVVSSGKHGELLENCAWYEELHELNKGRGGL